MLPSQMPRALVLTALLALSHALTFAQQGGGTDTLEQYFKITRGELTQKRDSALDALIHLAPEQAKKFRSIRDAYDAELKTWAEQRVTLMKDFAKVQDKLTAESAKAMADRLFKLEEDRNVLRRKYFDRVSAEISPVVAVQFMQLQRQFETMGDLKAATLVPLATQ